MTFLCDLHLHSRFSRATSRELSPRHLDMWARIKGLDVIGTSDFTHPGWREELKRDLVRDDATGLYKYAQSHENIPFLPPTAACYSKRTPLFLPQTEISSIYKKNGKVRKIHNLIFVPTLEDAERFSQRLSKIGNLNSDGRPILGLDAHDLLELLLEIVPDGCLIPAHIWTPWFSLFGSRSGFDSMEECFEDLTSEIFALETGLSSDPHMNRLVSALDQFALISNSDAHSGTKLAREVNVFSGTPTYAGIFQALRASARREQNQESLACSFKGTYEFYPEEGKYHLDGHRACQVSLNPLETRKHNNICPVCGNPLTVGVLHRVMDLADRNSRPNLPFEPPFISFMPLLEITAELLNVGTSSQKALNEYGAIITKLGSELDVLSTVPLSDIASYWDTLGVAIGRLRRGEVLLKGGYDGEFGEVHLFTREELGFKPKGKSEKRSCPELTKPKQNLETLTQFQALTKEQISQTITPISYSNEQEQVIAHSDAPALVLAGPGAGKTHVLIGRIQHLAQQLNPDDILALTFTRRAASEMQARLGKLLPKGAPCCTTIHAFCWQLLKKHEPTAQLLNEDAALRLFQDASTMNSREATRSWQKINLLREQCLLSTPEYVDDKILFDAYQNLAKKKISTPVYDFTGVLEKAVELILESGLKYKSVLVDEVQDCTQLNLHIIRSLLPENGAGFFGIGDPDQSIYAFRGACSNIVGVLQNFWNDLHLYHLGQSFRSGKQILDTAQTFIKEPQCGLLRAAKDIRTVLHFCRASSHAAEANWIAKQCATLLGTTAHTLQDSKQDDFAGTLAPNEIAILVRFKILIPQLAKAMSKLGIPVQEPQTEAFWQDECLQHFLRLLDPTAPDTTLGTDFPFLPHDLPKPSLILPWLEAQEWSSYEIGKSAAFKKLCAFWDSCGNWPNFFEKLNLLMLEEDVRSKAEAVQIMTLHAAKGLEFKAVFIPCLESGILPSDESILGSGAEKKSDYEEEKRLFYVGITRATQLLFLSCAEQRTLYGKSMTLPVSPFLSSIEHFFQKSCIKERRKKVQTQGSLFSI